MNFDSTESKSIPSDLPLERSAELLLLAAVLLLAICGLIYELVAGTVSSYLVGDSVTQFSIVIGLYLTAMGIGSFLSKYIRKKLLAKLAWVELGVGLVGGFLALAAMAAYSYTEAYTPVLVTMVTAVGVLVGLEIPILVRILRNLSGLRLTLSHVLCADYLGALAASLGFPFLLLPHLGLTRACFAMGFVNVVVAGILVYRFRHHMQGHLRPLVASCVAGAVVMGIGTGYSTRMVSFLEDRLYQDDIIYAADTPYQRVVITRWRNDIRLFLNGHLQFSSVDEYRYHEALVHPALGSAARVKNILILGGGDGMAAREVLKYEEVERVDLVDIDSHVTQLFSENRLLISLNEGALTDSRVHVQNEDALVFLRNNQRHYDAILVDLPDPDTPNLSKLYAKSFYRLAGRHLAAGGAMSVQSTSPFRARKAYWCIARTMREGFQELRRGRRLRVHPYHTLVPTFGQWGFMLASENQEPLSKIELSVPTRYLNADVLPGLFQFPRDMGEIETPVSRLNDPVVCRLYREGYHKYLD
mgnify:FL=1